MPRGIYKRTPDMMTGKIGHPAWNKGLKGIHLSPDTEFKKGGKRQIKVGFDNYCYKGNNATYGSLHKWVKRWKGKPNRCDVCGADDKRMYHWANIDHRYRRILDDYIPMCVSCHRKYNKYNNRRDKK